VWTGRPYWQVQGALLNRAKGALSDIAAALGLPSVEVLTGIDPTSPAARPFTTAALDHCARARMGVEIDDVGGIEAGFVGS